jgi:seryl-tRNA synthetase
LNGTAVTARLLLAIMENFQTEEGKYEVPEVLEQFGAPRKSAIPSG